MQNKSLFVPIIALKKFFDVLQINLKTKPCLPVVFVEYFKKLLTIQRLKTQHLKVLTRGYSNLLTFSSQSVQKIIEINLNMGNPETFVIFEK